MEKNIIETITSLYPEYFYSLLVDIDTEIKIRYDEKERLIYFPLLSREANDISRLPCVENWYKSYVKFMVIVWSAGHS